jgi:hypothetical protein
MDHVGCGLVLELTVNASFDAPKGLVDNPHALQYGLIDATNILKEMITKRKCLFCKERMAGRSPHLVK